MITNVLTTYTNVLTNVLTNELTMTGCNFVCSLKQENPQVHRAFTLSIHSPAAMNTARMLSIHSPAAMNTARCLVFIVLMI